MICEGTPLCAAQNGWRIRHLSEVDNKQKMNILLAHAVNVHAHVPVALLGMNIEDILINAGPWVLGLVALMVFIESGVLFPFLPGDSLLFTTGLLHQQLGLAVPVMLIVFSIAAIAGDQVGYWLGHTFGRRLFKPNAKILSYDNLDKANIFFNKYGGKALILARFVPVVRTFVPLAAGIANYRYSKFATWNITGAILWVFLMTLGGVFLGGIDIIKNNVEVIALIIVFVSLIPIVIEVLRERAKNKRNA